MAIHPTQIRLDLTDLPEPPPPPDSPDFFLLSQSLHGWLPAWIGGGKNTRAIWRRRIEGFFMVRNLLRRMALWRGGFYVV